VPFRSALAQPLASLTAARHFEILADRDEMDEKLKLESV
jgi:hypothetical protein